MIYLQQSRTASRLIGHTKGDGTSISAAVEGTDYATPEKQFEDIETITLTEGVEVITRSTEPDSTPYDFSEMEIQFNFPVCTPIKITVHFANITFYYPIVTGNFGSTSYQTYYRVYFKNNGGIPFGYTSYHTNSPNNAGSIIAIASLLGLPSAMGKALHINAASGNFIPAGTIITIKGKRK